MTAYSDRMQKLRNEMPNDHLEYDRKKAYQKEQEILINNTPMTAKDREDALLDLKKELRTWQSEQRRTFNLAADLVFEQWQLGLRRHYGYLSDEMFQFIYSLSHDRNYYAGYDEVGEGMTAFIGLLEEYERIRTPENHL